jgi:hypothetical protein
MFICSVKANTVKLAAALLLSSVALVGLTAFGSEATAEALSQGESATVSVSYENVRTETDRRAFLSSFGYEVNTDAESTAEFTIPKALDAVLLGYNEIQKEQGLDLGKYTGKTVTRYTYLIPNYEGYDGKVYANLIVYRNRVIAADLTGVGGKGFVRALGASAE